MGTDPTRAEAGVPGSTTVASDAPPVPGLTARERTHATKTLTELHKVNTMEIALGRLAQDKAQSAAVKDYAQQLVTDHQSADKKVMDFATAHNLGVAAAPMPREPAVTATDTGMRRPATAPPTPGATVTPGTTAGTATGTGVAGSTPPGVVPGTVNDQSPVPALDPEGQRTLERLQKLEGPRFEKQFLTEMVRGHQKTLGKIKSAERQAKSPPLQTLLQELRTSVESHLERARDLQKAGAS